MENKDEQVIEVEYDASKVEEYTQNYIMEEEGTGAEDVQPYDTQTEVNEVPFEDMNEEGEVTIDEVEEVEEDDSNN